MYFIHGIEIMIRYLYKIMRNEKKQMITLVLPIFFSVFLIYFSYIVNLNIDNISAIKNDIVFKNYNIAIWCNSALTEKDYVRIKQYLEPYDYVERDLIFTNYNEMQVAIMGIDYKEEISKGFFDYEAVNAIMNSSFLSKLNEEEIHISYKEDEIIVDASRSDSQYEIIRDIGYSIAVPKNSIDFSDAGVFFVVNIQDEELLQFQKTIKENFDMIKTKTATESLEDYRAEYSDIVLGIMLLMCLAVVVCSIIVYNSFSMTMVKEQQNIGQLQSFGVRDIRCYAIYLCKIYVIAFIALFSGIIFGTLGVFLIKCIKLFDDFCFFTLKYIDGIGIGLCAILEVIILTIVYKTVISKTKKNSIVENLRGNRESIILKKYRLSTFIISIFLLFVIRIISENMFLWFSQCEIIIRMVISVFYMGLSIFLIVFILSRCLYYFNKILQKVSAYFDFKLILFAIKNFIATEKQILIVFIIYTMAIIVSTGVYCNFDCFSKTIKNEVDKMYNYNIQLIGSGVLSHSELNKLSSIEGISFIDAVALIEIKIDSYDVIIEDIKNVDTFMMANNTDVSSLLNEENKGANIVITSNLAKRLGWVEKSNYQVIVNDKRYDLYVVEIVESSDYIDERIYSYNSLLADEYPYQQFVYRVGLSDNQDSEEILEKISEKGLSFLATVDIEDYKDEMIQEIIGNITILNIMCIAIVIIAFASVINILSSYVKQQQGIYASIIAIGSSKGFILKTIVIDILIVFIYASIISFFIAPVFSCVLVTCMSTVTRREIYYQFSFEYCFVLCLVTILIGLCFAVYYGIKNSHINVIEKIKLKVN